MQCALGISLPPPGIWPGVFVFGLCAPCCMTTQESMGRSIVAAPWIPGDGLDMTGMLQAFQQFWRENSEVWQACYDYREAAPHITLQAL
jgi:hypothetical protein